MHGAHAVVVLTEWDEFSRLDFARVYESMQKPAFVFDGRNILDHAALRQIGFHVYGVGKPQPSQTQTAEERAVQLAEANKRASRVLAGAARAEAGETVAIQSADAYTGMGAAPAAPAGGGQATRLERTGTFGGMA